MLFNSLHYFIFFPLITAIYFSLPHKYRWYLLLGASYYFYMAWEPAYIILILLSTIIDYVTSILIYSSQKRNVKIWFLLLSLSTNFTLLFAFKYYNFFVTTLNTIFPIIGTNYQAALSNYLLPVGISFYTFQSIGYTIDVFRGDHKPERNFGLFSLYVAFFPQLVAGPIERSINLLPQFYKKIVFDYDRVALGLKIICWGLFKKMVVADRLGYYVDRVYNQPKEYSGLSLFIATVFFSFQIYCDFSGYTDVAIGSAKVLGFDLMENFRRPYFSKSISEFWKRWHISLSSWFRDYLYIPLGGNRVSTSRLYLNIIIVFILSGLWHGANWTFIIWGFFHGSCLIMSLATNKSREWLTTKLLMDRYPAWHNLFKVIFTFSLVTFSWIFFRAHSLTDALYITKQIALLFINMHLNNNFLYEITTGFPRAFITSLLAITILIGVDFFERKRSIWSYLSSQPTIVRWSAYYILIFSIIMFGVHKASPFLYFQF